MKNNKIAWIYIYIALIGIIAFVIVMWVTPYGSGVSSDSTVYIGGVKGLLSGRGFSINGVPITHFPPLYPLFLAATGLFENDLVQAARLLNAILFGINAGMIALAVYSITERNFLASICAVLFFLSSAPLLKVHTWAWSEPLFIALSLSCAILLSMYAARPTMRLLVASSLLLGFALVTRYIGIAFLPAALIIVFIGGSGQNIIQRFRNVLVWFILALAPLGVWFARNFFAGGTAANRTLTSHPASIYEYGKGFAAIVIDLFVPTSLAAGVKLSIFGLLAILLSVLLGILYKRRQGTIDWRRMDMAMTASCSLFFLFFIPFLFISISFFDVSTQVDARILSPILVFLIVGLFSAIWTLSQMLKENVVWRGFLVLIALSISLKAPNALQTATAIRTNGLGYTARQWQESECVAFVRSRVGNAKIYSNGADVLGILTEKQVLSIPRKKDPTSLMDNPLYDEEIASMCGDIRENKALVVYLDQITWRWYLPSQTEVEATCRLPDPQYFADGTVYGGQ